MSHNNSKKANVFRTHILKTKINLQFGYLEKGKEPNDENVTVVGDIEVSPKMLFALAIGMVKAGLYHQNTYGSVLGFKISSDKPDCNDQQK